MNVAMRKRNATLFPSLLLITLLTFATSTPALAELGGGTESVSRDLAHFNATDRVTNAGTHSVHELQTGTGGRLREYVSNSGTVFAVTWVSPARPDMHQILGSYFNEYAQAVQTSRRHRGPVVVRSADLIVESGGHMRAFTGRAYAPTLMPEGVTANDIQ